MERTGPNGLRACVCVLGDIGHSPRMQYHSLSLAQAGYQVDIVAYQESRPHQKLVSSSRIQIHRLDRAASQWLVDHLPRLVAYALKALLQSFILFWTLITIPRPDFILVQNPPSVPVLPVAWLSSRLRRCRFIIDWHNYGYTIMALAFHGCHHHPLVRFYSWIEFWFGRFGDHHFCVSNAMKQDLMRRIHQEAVVLYDRPFDELFGRQLSTKDLHELFVKLQPELDPHHYRGDSNRTLMTEQYEPGQYRIRPDRPAILISSTSWTEDEDFQILFDALQQFDSLVKPQSLRILCVITGKGPMKSYYMDLVRRSKFSHIRFAFPWLEAEDYPRLMAAANLGVCLHKSSSGLDLPMKIVDMFACRVPVLAYRYTSIDELVREGQTGFLFSDPAELVECLKRVLGDQNQLAAMRQKIDAIFQQDTWHRNWSRNALPVFRWQ